MSDNPERDELAEANNPNHAATAVIRAFIVRQVGHDAGPGMTDQAEQLMAELALAGCLASPMAAGYRRTQPAAAEEASWCDHRECVDRVHLDGWHTGEDGTPFRQARPAADDTTPTEDHHVVEFRQDGWTIMHPLACRPNLFDCAVNREAEAQLTEAPDELGRFRCGLAEDGQFVVGEPAAACEPAPVDDSTVERVARAIFERHCHDKLHPFETRTVDEVWQDEPPEGRDEYRADARAAVRALAGEDPK